AAGQGLQDPVLAQVEPAPPPCEELAGLELRQYALGLEPLGQPDRGGRQPLGAGQVLLQLMGGDQPAPGEQIQVLLSRTRCCGHTSHPTPCEFLPEPSPGFAASRTFHNPVRARTYNGPCPHCSHEATVLTD